MEDAVAPSAAMVDETKPPKTLDEFKRLFAEARDVLQSNRKEQQIDDDYYHGYQLTREERQVLRERRQPDTVFNRYRKAINGTLGVLKGGETSPRAYGRNPQDEDAADVVSKVLRYVADKNHFQDQRIKCARDYLVPGNCAILIEVDEDKRPLTTTINWEEFFYDPRSRREDFSDARYLGVAKWMYADDVSALYPDKKAEVEDAFNSAAPVALDDTFEDRPLNALSNWIDRRRRRILVIEVYHREANGWWRTCFQAGGILESSLSPYKDERGKPVCAIEAQSCYIDRENNRMGIGRDMRSPQDEFNKRRQKLLHLLNNRQLKASDPMSYMPIDAEVARKEAARPDGILPPGWEPVPLTDMSTGQFNLLTLAEGEMDREGPNPAILGRQGADESGRAQMVRQQAGLTEQAVLFGGIEAWELRVYRAMWARCKQFWTAPDYVRVTDDIGAPQYVGINQPQMGQPQVVAHPETGMAMIQPSMLGYQNALAEMDVDIVLDTVANTANLQQEQFQILAELGGKGYQLPLEIIIEASSLPNKRQIIEKLQAQSQQPNPGQQLQMQQAQQQVRLTSAQADLAEAQAIDAGWNGQGGGQQPEPPDPLMPHLAQTEQARAEELSSRAALNAARTRTELLKPHLESAAMALQGKQQQQRAAAGPQSGASG